MASWKKIIVSGSNAELNQITSSAGINIKTVGSLSNGISFGDGDTGFYENADDDFLFKRAGLTVFRANTSSQLDIGTSALFYNQVGGFWIKTAAGSAGTPNYVFRGDENTGMFRIGADRLGFSAGGTLQLEISSNKISGSLASTGSFGRVEATKFVGDGSGLTGLTSAAIETYNTSGDNRILTSVDSSTVQGEAGLTFDGSELRVQGDIVAENFIVSSSVTHMTQSFSSGSTIFGDTSDDTHQFTGSLNISGSVNLDKNSHFQIIQPGGGIFKILTTGNQTSIEGGNITLTSNQGLKATKFQSNEINTYSNSYDAIDIGEGYIPGTGMRWGYVEILSNSSKTFTAGEAQLTVAPNSGSFEGIKIVGNQDQAADYLRIQSGSSDILNITHNGSVSGSATSTGSFGHLELANRDTDASFEFGRAHIGYIGHSDMAGFSHVDNNSANSFALVQNAAGKTIINAKSGQPIAFKINNFDKVQISSDGNLGVGIETATEKLHVVGNSLITGAVTIGGNLIVQGDTIQQQVANLNVEDRFILLNSGSASGDGGIVVQTESADGDGVAFAYDDSESRWSFQQGTKLNASASAVAPDAYASAVVTSDDSNYQKNGNIRVEGGEIYIYVE